MPMFPNGNRKEPGERKPISHEIEQHRRAYDANKLEQSKTTSFVPRGRTAVYTEDFSKAIKDLSEVPAGQAVVLMERLPLQLLECYLLAEEYGQNRPDVLRRFPKVGPSARARYAPAIAGLPKSKPKAKKAKTVPPVPEATVAVEVTADVENDNVEA